MLADFGARFPPAVWNPDAVPKPVPWLVEGLWLRNGITATLGPEKSGKSRFIGWILAGMLGQQSGGPVIYTEDGRVLYRHTGFNRVLYLNAEEQTEDVQARVNTYARHLGFEPKREWPITTVNAAGMQLQSPREREAFEKTYLAKGGYDLVIIDPLRRVHTGDENNNSAMAPLHNDLRRWTNQYKLTLNLLHHTPKLSDDADLGRLATWSRGASDLVTLLDGGVMMRTIAQGSERSVREVRRMGRFPVLQDLTMYDYGDPRGFLASHDAR